MTDIVNSSTRSSMMSGIKAKNTKPEMTVRSALFACGYRFRLHRKDLPGNPDVVLTRHKTIVLIHGCFWHLHRNCKFAKIPSTRTEFWKTKLANNARRDEIAIQKLIEQGWRVLTVWECYLKATSKETLKAKLKEWISGTETSGEFSALPPEVT